MDSDLCALPSAKEFAKTRTRRFIALCRSSQPKNKNRFLGLVRRSYSGNAYVLVISDYFTKWTEAFATAGMCAETVAIILVYQYMTRFGIIREIISDQGRHFESELFKGLCSRLWIDKKRCPPIHSQNKS